MERRLTIKFTPNALADLEEKTGCNILEKIAPRELLKSLYDAGNEIYKNKKNHSEDSLPISYDAIENIFNTILKVVSLKTIRELVYIGSLGTLNSLEAAGEKLQLYLDKYEDGIVGAYLQILKELDADMRYLGIGGLKLDVLIDSLLSQGNKLKDSLNLEVIQGGNNTDAISESDD